MTNEVTTTPDTATTFRLLHEALRTDVNRLVASLRTLDPHDRRRGAGLHRWYRQLLRQIHGHHRAEDEVYFAALAERVAAFAAGGQAQMDDDHRFVSSLADRLAGRLEEVAATGGAVAASAALDDAAALARLLDDHFRHEEQAVVPLLVASFSEAELASLGARADRIHTPGELAFLLPWFLEHVPAGERRAMARSMPLPLRAVAAACTPRYRRLVRTAGLA